MKTSLAVLCLLLVTQVAWSASDLRLETSASGWSLWQGEELRWRGPGHLPAQQPDSPILPPGNQRDEFNLIDTWQCAGSDLQFSVYDLNSDGALDIAYSDYGGTTHVRQSNLDDSFPMVHELPNPYGSYYTTMLCAGDADADGLGELVYGSGTSGVPRELLVVESAVLGSYPTTIVAHVPEMNIGVNHMRRADLDADGRREYVGTTQGTHDRSVAIWENRADNLYTQVFSTHFGPVWTVSGEPSVGDFDNDGRGDLIVVECGDASTVHVLECYGDDMYQEVWSALVPVDNLYWSAPGPDLDRDGRGDFALCGGSGWVTAVWDFFMFESAADNEYALVWSWETVSGMIDGGVATGDVDGDAANELLCQVPTASYVFRATGDNQLEQVWSLPGGVRGQGGCRIVAPDLDRDGKGELIWWRQFSPGIAVVYERAGVSDFAGSESVMAQPRLLVSNPGASEVMIRYSLPQNALESPARLAIYGSDGRLVRSLLEETCTPGDHLLRWDGRDQRGLAAPGGVYLCALLWNSTRSLQRVLLLR